MDINSWLNKYRVIAVEDIQSPAAVALVNFINSRAEETARFVEGRCSENCELVLLDIRTGRPQRSIYKINHVERIAVRFAAGDKMPLVYVLRANFPDTPHQQLPFEGVPRAICIDDRTWAEARLTWTPAELIERILNWFERAAHGSLHDARQPLDPLIFWSNLKFIISRCDLANAEHLDLVGEHDQQYQDTLRVKHMEKLCSGSTPLEPIALVAYKVVPEKMRRLTFAPINLGSLAKMLEARGIDLFDDLRTKFRNWLQQAEQQAWRINSRFAVIVEMPIIAPDDAERNGTDLRAFVSEEAAGDIAVALGVAERAPCGVGSSVGYVQRLSPSDNDETAVNAIAVQSAEIHYEFDRPLATLLCGRAEPDERNVVLVGAGAIGSHLAECLVREGRFRWTIIDEDRLLPHNLARHTARMTEVNKAKADLVANAVNSMIDSETPIAKALVANVMTEGEMRAETDEALNAADLIIDATASVQACRYLSDHPSKAKRVGAFFNPAGNAGILLAEPDDRKLTLRDLEAQYFALVSVDRRLVDHLTPSENGFAYSGACRAITNFMPESNVMTLSGLLTGALGKAVDEHNAALQVFSLRGNGTVNVIAIKPSVMKRVNAGEWQITIDQALLECICSMRNRKLPNETGGVLTGVVDIPAKHIHLANAAPAPKDSIETPDEFVRGTCGVRNYLDDVSTRTRGQVRYVGEWHSHPPVSSARPSATDLNQIDWLSSLLEHDTLPALMMIVGEGEYSIIFTQSEAKFCECFIERKDNLE